MCKLFAVVEIENQKNAELFAKYAIPQITKEDDDGLGIMRLGENGVHIQRWLEPPTVVRKKQGVALLKYDKALKHQQQNEVGKVSKQLQAIAVHGRFATCVVSLENTHPFYRQGAALMHNGIISNVAQYEREVSTCDSEALLSQYLKHNIKDKPGSLTDALDGMQGYYAAIVFNDNGVIDVWRDDAASLYMAHVRNVGIVIATTMEIITKTAKKLRAYVTGLDEILPYTSIRWTNGVNPVISSFTAEKYYQSILTPTKAQTDGMLDEINSDKPDVENDQKYKWWKDEEDYYGEGGYSPREWKRFPPEPSDEEIADERMLPNMEKINACIVLVTMKLQRYMML